MVDALIGDPHRVVEEERVVVEPRRNRVDAGVRIAAGDLAVRVDVPSFGGDCVDRHRFVGHRRVRSEHRPCLNEARVGDQPLDPAGLVELEELGDRLVDEQRLVDDRDQHRQDEPLAEDGHAPAKPVDDGRAGRRQGGCRRGRGARHAAGGEPEPYRDRLAPNRESDRSPRFASCRSPGRRSGPDQSRPSGSARRVVATASARVVRRPCSSTATMVLASSSGGESLRVGRNVGARTRAGSARTGRGGRTRRASWKQTPQPASKYRVTRRRLRAGEPPEQLPLGGGQQERRVADHRPGEDPQVDEALETRGAGR